jgi:GAF domain-containing protein
VSLLGAEGACIALGAGEYLHIVAAFGSADVLSGVHLPVDASLMGRAVRTNQPVVVNDPRGTSVARAVQQLYQVERAVIAPLVAGSGTIGAIAVLNRPRPFDDEDTRVLQRLADQVAVAIVNARLFEEVERITRQWKLAFDGTASGIVVLEESLIVSRCNTRAAELCALSIPSLLGRHFLDVLLREPNVPERRQLEQTIARALQDRERVRTTVPDPISGHAYALVISPHPEGGCVITFDLADS